jgi:type IV pilus assembly protein PilC
MERSTTLKKKIKGAMIYPSIVITVMVIIAILMMIFVLPSITGIFKQMGTELPATTQFLISASDFMVANTILALTVIGQL